MSAPVVPHRDRRPGYVIAGIVALFVAARMAWGALRMARAWH